MADWLSRYPLKGRRVSATYEPNPQRCTFGTQGGCWNLRVDWDPAGEIASGRIDDRSARVTEAWTGPQVAWKMARGGKGAFGGAKINSYSVWLGFCIVFLLGLAEYRRPLSWRNLDLLMLLSFSVSVWFFNRGNVFAAVPLAYPPLAYLLVRCLWIGWTGRAVRGRFVWPYWVLLAAAIEVTFPLHTRQLRRRQRLGLRRTRQLGLRPLARRLRRGRLRHHTTHSHQQVRRQVPELHVEDRIRFGKINPAP